MTDAEIVAEHRTRKSTPILITLIITTLSVALYARSVYREAAEADKLRPKTVAGRSHP